MAAGQPLGMSDGRTGALIGAAGEVAGSRGSSLPRGNIIKSEPSKCLPVARAGTRGYPQEQALAWVGAGLPARSALRLVCADMNSRVQVNVRLHKLSRADKRELTAIRSILCVGQSE